MEMKIKEAVSIVETALPKRYACLLWDAWDIIRKELGEDSKTSHNELITKFPKTYAESERLFLEWWHTGGRRDTLSRKNMVMFYNIIVGNNGH